MRPYEARFLLPLLAVPALGACVTAPVVREAAVVPPPAFTAQDGELANAPLDSWWRLYSDPQLTAFVEQALGRGFAVREAYSRLEEARAIRAGALAAFGPQGELGVNGQIQRNEQLSGGMAFNIPGIPPGAFGGSITNATGGVTLPVSWELDLFGRRAVTRQVADADLAASRFNYEGVRSATAAEVARTLFQARGLAAQIEDARASAGIQRRLFDLLRQRAERGLAPRTEADRVEADLAQAEAQTADLVAALDATRRALLVLVGSGMSPVDAVQVEPAISPPPAVPAAIPGELLQRRPDVREAQARLQGAIGNVRLAELAFFPRITLQPTAGLNLTSGALPGVSAIAGLGAGLSAPLFDRVRLRSQLGASSARAEGAVLAYERTVQTAYSEADQALIRLAADRTRIARLEAGAAAAQRAYEAALRRFELGFSSLQETLDAERVARVARTALTAARLEGLQRSVQAFQALGGGWDATVADGDIRGS